MSVLQPGPATAMPTAPHPLDGNEEAIGEGERLYHHFNCSGCHFAGGGGIGPPLMDDEWIYGSSSRNIFYSIIEGRPQGMPAFGGRVPEEQLWRIVAYVRSLSGLDKRERQQEQTAARQLEPDLVQQGAQVFVTGPCVMCHTVDGTVARGTVGPDLTHVASREWLAAGTLPNTKGHLAGWILNPQNLKPGSRMPPTALSSADLHSLVAYLQSLH
jgi:mono/diheme cytochrome c family protein